MLLVRSFRGHDRGRLYLLIAYDDKMAELVDGRLRPLENPKRKNLKHLEALAEIEEIEISNEAIAQYIQDMKECVDVKRRYD